MRATCAVAQRALQRAVWLTRSLVAVCSKRPQLQVDKFSIGSDKVGSQPLDNDVYKQNRAYCGRVLRVASLRTSDHGLPALLFGRPQSLSPVSAWPMPRP